MGSFGQVTVSWKVNPETTEDIYPTSGTIVFEDLETEVNSYLFHLNLFF